MTLPTLKVEIDFSSGPSFSYPLILDDLVYGFLDTNTLGDAPANLVDISSQVMKDMKKIIKKLEEVKDLLELNLEASNMDVEHMLQRVEDMIEELEETGQFEFEEIED